MSRPVIQVACRHGGKRITECTICRGTGFVLVHAGFDGRAKPCRHRGGDLATCTTCRGSGWAGLADEPHGRTDPGPTVPESP